MSYLLDAEKAARIALANTSPRYRSIEKIESWSTGAQYAGRPNWWTSGEPIWECAPCVQYPVVKIAARSNTDLLFGEGQFPTITTKQASDDGQEASAGYDTENGLSDDDASTLDRFLAEYHKAAGFKAHCREAFGAAQVSRTAVAIHGHRKGKPFCDLFPAKWCTPEFVDEAVSRIEIKYPYFEEYQDKGGKWRVRTMLFRRVIDATSDTTYLPAEAREDGIEPESWTVDASKTVPNHGLGFCPVIWYPFMRGCAAVNVIDGQAIHETDTDEIQALDIALSQKHRCALLSEPQPVETGVTADHNPTGELGRVAMVPSTERGGLLPDAPGYAGGDPGAVTGHFVAGTHGKPARKKGPGHIWRYPDKDSKVAYIAYPDSVLKGMQEHADDLLRKIEESLAVVLPKPSEFKFAAAISGEALKVTRQRQFSRCDQYRDDAEENFLIPSVDIQLRIAVKARESLRVPGINDVLPILDRLSTPEWTSPSYTISWGAYTEQSSGDEKSVVDLIVAARNSKLITLKMGLEKLREEGVFQIENIQAVLDELEQESAEDAEKEVEQTGALAAVTAEAAPEVVA